MTESNRLLRYYGYVVTPVTEKNNPVIDVFIPELFPFTSGEVSTTPEIFEIDIKDDIAGAIKRRLHLITTVPATYMSQGRPNEDVPDVHFGEEILIIANIGQNEFHWLPTGVKQHLRTTEHVRLTVSNKNEQTDPLDTDHEYCLEIDTRYRKHVKIKTTTATGEPVAYLMEFDTEKGTFTLNDDHGNHIFLDSQAHLWHILNGSKTEIKLDKENLLAYAPNDIIAKADNDVKVEAGNNFHCVAGNLFGITAKEFGSKCEQQMLDCQDGHLKCSKQLVITAPKIGMNGKIFAPEQVFLGPVLAGGYGVIPAVPPVEGGTVDMSGDGGSAAGGGSGGGDDPAPSAERHCAAWEECVEAIQTLATAIKTVGEAVPTGDGGAAGAVGQINSAKMIKNRGE